MRLIRAGLVSIDNTIGAVSDNLEKAIGYGSELAKLGATLVVFQEQLLGGYPAEDLTHSPAFIEAQWRALLEFVSETEEYDTVFVVGLSVRVGSMTYNANATVYSGEIVGIVPKEHLPTYGVFYEKRVFASGVPGLYSKIPTEIDDVGIPFGDLLYEFPFGTLATPVCEDGWTPDGPLARRGIAEIQAITNASPGRLGVVDTRHQMLSTRSADNECVILAAYAVGANGSLIFDGGGYCFQNGQLLAEKERFHEGWKIVDIDLSRTERIRNQNTTWRMRQEQNAREEATFHVISCDGPEYYLGPISWEFARRYSFLPSDPLKRKEALDYLERLMVCGLKGYFEKTTAKFKRILIALSGGKDSALTAVLAWRYAVQKFLHKSDGSDESIKDFIHCWSMPTHFNSDETKSIARDLCEELGLRFGEQPIEEEFKLEAASVERMTGRPVSKRTKGNIQARIRGQRMWNMSNEEDGLWIQTGNMSEKAVGYTTIGGDLMGNYSLIGNIPKTVVSELLMHMKQKYDLKFVDALMNTRASAELDEDQFDEDELMPFPVLDICFLLYVGEHYAPDDMYRIMRAYWTDDELKTMDSRYVSGKLKDWIERFVNLFHASIHKWVQSPETAHVGSLDLDRERALQIPVVHRKDYIQDAIKKMRKLP